METQAWLTARDGRLYLRCVICDLVWLSPEQRLSPEWERERYVRHQNSALDLAYLGYLAKLADEVVFGLRRAAEGLDFGCGPSEGMRALLEPRGFLLRSYDPFFFPDADALSRSYDFVLCSEAAEHFHHPAAAWERLSTLLRPGGRLGVSSCLRAADADFSEWFYRRDTTHVCFYSERTVHWIARRFRWRLLKLESPLWLLEA